MLQATVNNKSFNIQADEDTIVINGKLKWDIEQVQDGYFHILYHQKSYRAEVVSNDPTTKTFTWKINGRLYTVNVKDKFDLLLEKMGIEARNRKQSKLHQSAYAEYNHRPEVKKAIAFSWATLLFLKPWKWKIFWSHRVRLDQINQNKKRRQCRKRFCSDWVLIHIVFRKKSLYCFLILSPGYYNF